MKILWLLFVLHTAFAQPGFGRSYLRNSRLCHQWSCINTKLGLPDSLPQSEQFENVLRSLLPAGAWQNVVEQVIHTCYDDRKRRYTNTCPGQALMQCTVDQLVNNCPEESLRKDDACAPVNSLAGLRNMFSQSRYENLERNLPYERRPEWFLRNYFDSKCCNLPNLFNSTTLTECGFTTMMEYFKHDSQFESKVVLRSQALPESPVFFHYTPTEASNIENTLHVVSLKDIKPEVSESEPNPDPLNCCDMSDFIQPTWRRECGTKFEWSKQTRLNIKDSVTVSTTVAPTTVRTVTHRDLMVVPQSCEQETCVFNKLNITKNGSVDVEAFKKLLDSLTDSQPAWSKAKARVLTTCLTKPLDYFADCQINKLLACTFDVLSENCPLSESAPKHDACKHSKEDRICQISSSKSRPKHRRSPCVLPELVDTEILTECGLNSLTRVEQVVQTASKPKKFSFAWQHKCRDLSPSTSCLINKMGALNKYGFVDYFRMKDEIRKFTENNEFSYNLEIYLNAFTMNPLYGEHCNSAKKLLNVVDSILLTCPASKRNTSPQCTKLFEDITNTPANGNTTKEQNDKVLKHFHHVFFPQNQQTNKPASPPQHTSKIIKKPIYNYGILSSQYAPKVDIIPVKPTVVKKPLVILPVYMRLPHSNFVSYGPHLQDGVLRSPFGLHNQIAQAHITATPAPVSYGPHLQDGVLRSPYGLHNQIAQAHITATPAPVSYGPHLQDGVLRSPFGLHNQIAQAHITATPAPVSYGPHLQDGVLRSPFGLHNQIAQAHITATPAPVSYGPHLQDGVLRSPFGLHNQIAQAHITATPAPVSYGPHLQDGVLRSPFGLHNQIAQAHITATPAPVSYGPHLQDGVLRSPFGLHNQIAQAHITATPAPVSYGPHLQDGVLRSPYGLHSQISQAHINTTPISTPI